MKYNILVTGAGAIIGYGIIQSLKKSNLNLNIVATDIYNDAYGKNIADSFCQGVLASSDEYIDRINSIVEKEKIDLIIPGIEQDLYQLFLNKDKVNAKIVLNNELSIQLSKDKWRTFTYLNEHFSNNLIPTLMHKNFEECAQELGLPFLLKPRSSYASKGIHIINNQREFDFFTEGQMENLIFQKIIGTMNSEYTVSVFGDGNGGFYDSISLKRTLSGEGATGKATFVDDEKINEYVAELVRVLQPIGPTNIQLRIENEIPYLLEINPRISSACSLRTSFGYNEPEMCVLYFLFNQSIAQSIKKPGSAVRFIDDYITYEN